MQVHTQVLPMTHPSHPKHAVADAKNAVIEVSAFIPMLLLALALVAWLAFQALQQVRERQQLAAVEASLAQPEQAASQLRASLDAVAGATAKLATQGNANAQVVVEELRKRGVTINPAGAAKPQ